MTSSCLISSLFGGAHIILMPHTKNYATMPSASNLCISQKPFAANTFSFVSQLLGCQLVPGGAPFSQLDRFEKLSPSHAVKNMSKQEITETTKLIQGGRRWKWMKGCESSLSVYSWQEHQMIPSFMRGIYPWRDTRGHDDGRHEDWKKKLQPGKNQPTSHIIGNDLSAKHAAGVVNWALN